jgi:hypothetical protein
MNEKFNLTGKRFGKWFVERLEKCYNKSGYGLLWRCVCECGNIRAIQGSSLRAGRSKRCRPCSAKDRIKKRTSKLGVFSHLYYRIRQSANKRKIPIYISQEECKQLLIKQNYKCALSGLDLIVANTVKEHHYGVTTASLDRIDSSKSYTIDNVQWVHKWVNRMKNKVPEKEFINLCRMVVSHYDNKHCANR